MSRRRAPRESLVSRSLLRVYRFDMRKTIKQSRRGCRRVLRVPAALSVGCPLSLALLVRCGSLIGSCLVGVHGAFCPLSDLVAVSCSAFPNDLAPRSLHDRRVVPAVCVVVSPLQEEKDGEKRRFSDGSDGFSDGSDGVLSELKPLQNNKLDINSDGKTVFS